MNIKPDEKIILTNECINVNYYIKQRINQIIKNGKKDKNLTKLRLEVDSGGCSGFQYKFSFDYKEPNKEDLYYL